MARGTLVLAAIFLLTIPVRAGELGVLTVDPVELLDGKEVEGKPEISVLHSSYRYRFTTEANKATFLKAPARYEIQLGGACARMGPLSGRGQTSIHAVHDGRIYIFASEGCRKGFLSAPDRLLDRADPVPESTEESRRRGTEILQSILADVGGAAAVDAVKSYRETLVKHREHEGKRVEQRRISTIVFPDRHRLVQTWDDAQWGWVTTAEDAFDFSADRVVPLVASQREALERPFRHSLLAILRARERKDFLAVSAGASQVGETAVELLDVHYAGTATRLAVDAGTGRVLRASYRGRGSNAVIETIERSYGDFREINGLALATSSSVTVGGLPAPHLSGPFEVTLNGKINDADFRRPAREP